MQSIAQNIITILTIFRTRFEDLALKFNKKMPSEVCGLSVKARRLRLHEKGANLINLPSHMRRYFYTQKSNEVLQQKQKVRELYSSRAEDNDMAVLYELLEQSQDMLG